MVRLSEIMKTYTVAPVVGILVYGYIADKYMVAENEDEDEILEGLCPQRILLNDDWQQEVKEVVIEPAQPPFKSYAYYPPEYLKRNKVWTPACTTFALCAIVYRLTTGELPFVGNVPEELLASSEGIKFLAAKRLVGLDLEKVPKRMRGFLETGLMLHSNKRFKAIRDTEDIYSEICNHRDLFDNPIIETTELALPTEVFPKIFAGNEESSGFTLNVSSNISGSYDNIVGLEEQKEKLRIAIDTYRYPEEAKKYGLTLNGMIFYGPPGCCKTYFAKMTAAEMGYNTAIIYAKDISSPYLHETSIRIKELFQQAALHAPIVLILDEAEALMLKRGDYNSHSVIDETNAFVTELESCAERKIFTILTTNHPELMDSAILRSGRIDEKIYFPMPDEQTRLGLFRMFLKDRPIDEHIDYAVLSKLTANGYSSADIGKICTKAAQLAFRKRGLITHEMIENAIKDIAPSVYKDELRRYEDSRRFMEPTKYSINPIGFR